MYDEEKKNALPQKTTFTMEILKLKVPHEIPNIYFFNCSFETN